MRVLKAKTPSKFSRPVHSRPTATEVEEFCAMDNVGNLTEPEVRLEKL